jgi:CheY-like chemotaxis protein
MKINHTTTGLSRKTILVIDDDESIRLFIMSLLEKDYDVTPMTDGHDALVYLSKGFIPDLILTDMEMPNINGRVFLRRIRYSNSKHSKIPIIFITSVNSKAMISSMKKLQISDYIIKPFKQEDLIQKVHNILPLQVT